MRAESIEKVRKYCITDKQLEEKFGVKGMLDAVWLDFNKSEHFILLNL